jgi:hypothetical protein
VIETAIRQMQGTTDAIVEAGVGRSPELQLTAYVRIFLQRVVAARDSWIHQMMTRELADPTPALDLVIDQVLQPRMNYLAGVIAALLGCRPADRRVRRCMMSVQWQCLAAVDTRMPARLRPPVSSQDAAELAAHIVRFSLGGIRALAH